MREELSIGDTWRVLSVEHLCFPSMGDGGGFPCISTQALDLGNSPSLPDLWVTTLLGVEQSFHRGHLKTLGNHRYLHYDL